MTKYLSCAETAKLVRAALKKEFPGVKFAVRSKVYSGGASINVDWTDGPANNSVQNVIKRFEGSGFDGMIDYKYSKKHWMLPDGTVQLAYREDTEQSRGTVPGVGNAKPHPDAVLVTFGADYIFANRTISDNVYNAAIIKTAAKYGVTLGSIQDAYQLWVESANNWLTSITRSELMNLEIVKA